MVLRWTGRSGKAFWDACQTNYCQIGSLEADGLQTRLRTVVLAGNVLPAYGAESVWHDGKIVSRLRSAGHAHTIDKSIGYCYLPLPLAKPGTEVEIELFGERVPAKVTLPIHDPKGERLKV